MRFTASSVRLGVVAAAAQPVFERVGTDGGDDEHEHTGAALERVRDLEVGDVHAELAGQRRHLGDHARAVGHRDAELDQVGVDRRRRPAGCGARHAPARAARAARPDPRRRRGRAPRCSASRYASSAASTASRLATQDVGPDAGVARRDARHVAEAARPRGAAACGALPRARSRRPSACSPRAAARGSRARRARRDVRASPTRLRRRARAAAHAAA